MKIFNHVVEADLRSLQPWTHFKIHTYEMHRHLVWGRLSVLFGQPHLTPVTVCADCYGEIQMLHSGDECWNYCESCQQVEGNTTEITLEEYEAL